MILFVFVFTRVRGDTSDVTFGKEVVENPSAKCKKPLNETCIAPTPYYLDCGDQKAGCFSQPGHCCGCAGGECYRCDYHIQCNSTFGKCQPNFLLAPPNSSNTSTSNATVIRLVLADPLSTSTTREMVIYLEMQNNTKFRMDVFLKASNVFVQQTTIGIDGFGYAIYSDSNQNYNCASSRMSGKFFGFQLGSTLRIVNILGHLVAAFANSTVVYFGNKQQANAYLDPWTGRLQYFQFTGNVPEANVLFRVEQTVVYGDDLFTVPSFLSCQQSNIDSAVTF